MASDNLTFFSIVQSEAKLESGHDRLYGDGLYRIVRVEEERP
ncbi:hypothetical protein ACFWXO_22125 [Kitasatospora sp. NPDC059088]